MEREEEKKHEDAMIVTIPPDESKEKVRLNTEEGEIEERTSLRPLEKTQQDSVKEADEASECTKIVAMRAKLLHDRGFLLTQMLTVWLIQITLLTYIM